MTDADRIAELERRLALAEDRLELHNGAFWRQVGEWLVDMACRYIDARVAPLRATVERLERRAEADDTAARAVSRLRASREP